MFSIKLCNRETEDTKLCAVWINNARTLFQKVNAESKKDNSCASNGPANVSHLIEIKTQC